ncbi:MAG: hypothetical protein Q7S20_02790 [Gemmatimonadaceae bacterium]|nr:hypothetical protein [Gemmatimonadaceae bacterium]
MTTATESYKKVPYDLRTAKQIERRMIIDTLMILAAAGFPIRDSQYTGFGSIFFVDFILVHKLLGVRRMLTVEKDKTIRKRIKFNKPFSAVGIEMSKAEDVIPKLDRDQKHILWLDYDFRMNKIAVDDAAMASFVLSPGSILLVTVDVKRPDEGGPTDWFDFYEDEVGKFFGPGWTAENEFAQESLPNTNAQVLFNAINSGLSSRPNVHFIPLFNFLYEDGHPMLTVGGMIGTDADARVVGGCDFSRAPFIRQNVTLSPYHIRVPILTRKERTALDHHMPCGDDWKPKEFEMAPEDIASYREIYRYFPVYAELLL